jgi:hypothetical protein
MSKKCKICLKKLTMLEKEFNRCKCSKLFCNIHKYPEEHQCNLFNDIVNEKKKYLEKQMVEVSPEKLVKI